MSVGFPRPGHVIQRWTRNSAVAFAAIGLLLAVLATGPAWLSASAQARLDVLFIYIIVAAMWNALGGYGGLVSVGQQVFFGLGAYFAIRLSHEGVPVFAALVLAGILVAVLAVPIGEFMLRLRGGEFAIGMWVLAELGHLCVNLDPLVQGETGTSLIALNGYAPALRLAVNYWLSLGAMVAILGGLLVALRGRLGESVQAIRDNEEAAASVGVRVLLNKRVIFVLAAGGAGLAGALWLGNAITFQPKSYFGVQWTAYMIFMALVGGLGTFEGPVIGAVIFFVLEQMLGAAGVWYLISLGATALAFALFLPRGLWGLAEQRLGLRLIPVGYRLVLPPAAADRNSRGDTA